MARRHRIDFRKPLAGPDSKVVYHCYASHGKAFGPNPPWGANLRALAINLETREVKWVDSWFSNRAIEFQCEEMRGITGWAMLGWVMADGTLPLGELDVVDPIMYNDERGLPLLDSRDRQLAMYPGSQPPHPK